MNEPDLKAILENDAAAQCAKMNLRLFLDADIYAGETVLWAESICITEIDAGTTKAVSKWSRLRDFMVNKVRRLIGKGDW